MKAIILNLKKSETLKKVRLFFKGIMNKLSLKEYIYSIMVEHNEECLYATTSEVQEIVEDELASIKIHDDYDIEDIVRNMDIKHEFDILESYEVNDKILDALEDFKKEQSPFTEDDEYQLKAEITHNVIEALEAKKSPTIKDVENQLETLQKLSLIVLEFAMKKEVTLTQEEHYFMFEALNELVNMKGGYKFNIK